MGLLPSVQGLGLGGFVARVPSEQLHVGANPSEHMGPLAKAEATTRGRRRRWSILLICWRDQLSGGECGGENPRADYIEELNQRPPDVTKVYSGGSFWNMFYVSKLKTT